MVSSDAADSAHPDDRRLIEFAERRLSAAERAEVQAHLEACATCRELLSAVSNHFIVRVAFDALSAARAVNRVRATRWSAPGLTR